MRVETSDEVLVARAQDGDEEAFTALLVRHYDLIFRLALRLLGRVHDAEDLTQEVCAGLHAKLARYRNEAKFTTWLRRVVVNAVHDWRRRMFRNARKASGWGDWELSRRADAEAEAERSAWLSWAMTALSQELRDTAVLVLGEEQTHAEAASVLGVSEGTISWRMSEIRKRLRAVAESEESYA